MLEQIFTLDNLLISVIIAVAYLVRGIAGFGSGLIAIPLLVILKVPLIVAVPTVVMLDYLASASHGIYNRQLIAWKDILPLIPFSIMGVLTAIYVFREIHPALLKQILGGFIILFAFYSFLASNPEKQHSRLWSILAGSLGGLIGTLFGTGGPFYIIYLQLRGLHKTALKATFATIFLLDGAGRLAAYWYADFYNIETFRLVLIMLPVMVVFLYIGGHIHLRISQQTFKYAIAILLLCSGVVLLIKP